MRRKTRTKVKKGLIISGIIVGIILIIIGIILLIKLNQKPDISYDDILVGKNYFKQITIDLNTKEVKRDNIETSLKEEFDISEEQENLAFSSEEEMKNAKTSIISSIQTIDEEQDTEIIYLFGQELSQIPLPVEEYQKQIESVTKEQIMEVAKNVAIHTIYLLKGQEGEN